MWMLLWKLWLANVSPHETIALRKCRKKQHHQQQRNKSSSNVEWDLELIEHIDAFFFHLCTQSALYSYRYCTVSMQRSEKEERATNIQPTNTIELYACFTSLKNSKRNKKNNKKNQNVSRKCMLNRDCIYWLVFYQTSFLSFSFPFVLSFAFSQIYTRFPFSYILYRYTHLYVSDNERIIRRCRGKFIARVYSLVGFFLRLLFFNDFHVDHLFVAVVAAIVVVAVALLLKPTKEPRKLSWILKRVSRSKSNDRKKQQQQQQVHRIHIHSEVDGTDRKCVFMQQTKWQTHEYGAWLPTR